MEDYTKATTDIFKLLEESDKVDMKTPEGDFVLIRKSRFMAKLDFVIELGYLCIAGLLITALIILL